MIIYDTGTTTTDGITFDDTSSTTTNAYYVPFPSQEPTDAELAVARINEFLRESGHVPRSRLLR